MFFTRLQPPDYRPSAFGQGLLVSHCTHLAVVGGQVGVSPAGTIGRGVAEQTRLALENIRGVLAEGRLDLGAVIKYTVQVTERAHIPEFERAAAEFLPDPPPAVTYVLTPALADPALLVEIEALAVS